MSDREHDLRDVVQSIHDDLELPEGYRAEIIGGQIAVAASPFGIHAFILQEIRDAAHGRLPREHRLYENITLEEPDGDRYIPDLALMPDALLRNRRQWTFPMGLCLLAVEVTSPGQEERDYHKATGYARAGVRVYLLVDQTRRRCFVHCDPEGGKYAQVTEVPFGEDVLLPLARSITIDTSKFYVA
ncbi:MAG TPA: Uma2 family endonuclease [Actinocrinis sp.]|nr:Uma2 family endonuclease [Actinocrinis sp.]